MVVQRAVHRKRRARGIAGVRNCSATEIKGVVVVVNDDLHDIRVLEFFTRQQRGRQRRHADARLLQERRASIDQFRRHQGLIALQVDDHPVIRPPRKPAYFRKTLGAGLVVLRGHAHVGAETFRHLGNSAIVRRDDDLACAAFRCPLVYVLQHRFARDEPQRLARQANRRIARGDDDDEVLHVSRSAILACNVSARRSSQARSSLAAMSTATVRYQLFGGAMDSHLTASFSVMITARASPNSS